MAKLKLFLDTNILIDLLADRKPFSNSAYLIFKFAGENVWQLYTSSNSILTTYSILESRIKIKEANLAIEKILKRVEIQDLAKKELLQAIKSKTKDLEDASQIECANKIENINYLITRDAKGFKNSIVKVLTPEELLLLFDKE